MDCVVDLVLVAVNMAGCSFVMKWGRHQVRSKMGKRKKSGRKLIETSLLWALGSLVTEHLYDGYRLYQIPTHMLGVFNINDGSCAEVLLLFALSWIACSGHPMQQVEASSCSLSAWRLFCVQH